MLDQERMPRHVAIIMDGNGRWAKNRGLPRLAGHNAGMKAMKKYPSVLRTEYVYALLAEQNPKKAEKLMAQFRQCAKSYPYPSEIEGERQLMVLAAAKMTVQKEHTHGTQTGN